MDIMGVPGTRDETLEPQWGVVTRVVSNLTREAGVRAIYLAGSLARGTADTYSDVDLLVSLDAHRMRNLWTHRHQIAHIPQPGILDLDCQWGDPSSLSYAVLQNGVYLDLTLVGGPRTFLRRTPSFCGRRLTLRRLWTRRTMPPFPCPSTPWMMRCGCFDKAFPDKAGKP